MPRWLRVVRAALGTGLTFAVGVGAVSGLIASGFLVLGKITALEFLQVVGRFSVVAFILGLAFSVILAIAARRRDFSRLTPAKVGAFGVGAGLVYFAVISLNGIGRWTPAVALANFLLLTIMGGASAIAILLIARKAQSSLAPPDERQTLGVGHIENQVDTDIRVKSHAP